MMATAYNRITPQLRRKLLIGCFALAILAVAWLGACLGAARSRYRVTGKYDPATGYRIEYTVSSRYRKTVDKDAMAQANHELEAWAYDPTPPSPTSRWIDAHVFGRARSASSRSMSGHAIRQATIGGASPQGTTIDSQGYVDLGGISQLGRTVFKDHVHISGCPATWCGIDVQEGSYKGSKLILHIFCLLVRPKNSPINYGFVGKASTRADAIDVQYEMLSIRDSIHITKKQGESP